MEEITDTAIFKYIIIFIISVIQLGTIIYLKKIMSGSKEDPGLNIDKLNLDNKFDKIHDRIDEEKKIRTQGDEKLRDMIDDVKTEVNRNCLAISEINIKHKKDGKQN